MRREWDESELIEKALKRIEEESLFGRFLKIDYIADRAYQRVALKFVLYSAKAFDDGYCIPFKTQKNKNVQIALLATQSFVEHLVKEIDFDILKVLKESEPQDRKDDDYKLIIGDIA